MYTIDETADIPIMMLDRHIGMDSEDGMGIDGALFAQELLRLDGMGKKAIQIYVNCLGGNVVDGMNICNAILKSNTPVDTHNGGVAASMGGAVFMLGRKRTMADYSNLMVHNPGGSSDKNAIKAFTDSLSTMISAKSSISKDEVGFLMDRETWLNSAECFAKGFCTDIEVTSDANRKHVRASDSAKAMYNAAKDITNNIFNTNILDMKKVTAKLGLVDGANEDSVIAQIDKMTNDAAETLRIEKEKSDKAEKDLKDATDKIAKLEGEAAAAKLITDAAKVTADAAAKVVNEKKAKDVITAAVKIGKIQNKADVIEAWEKKLVDDFDGNVILIESLPLNRVAGSVVNSIGKVEDNSDAIKSMGTAAGVMLQVQNRLKEKASV